MSSDSRRKSRTLILAAAAILLAGAAALAYRHLGPLTVYINGYPVHGFSISFATLAGLLAAGVVALFFMAGIGLILLALFVLMGAVMLFLAAPFLWPLIAIAVIIYLLAAATKHRH